MDKLHPGDKVWLISGSPDLIVVEYFDLARTVQVIWMTDTGYSTVVLHRLVLSTKPVRQVVDYSTI